MKILDKYGILILFSTIFIIGIIIRYTLGDNSTLWNIWGAIDISFAVALGILAFIAYRDFVHEKDLVRLIFHVDGKKDIDTGLCFLRKNCTRSEVIGLVEMIKTTKEPLEYDVSNLHKLLDEINQVQSGKAGKLYIPIKESEIKQFKISI